MGQPAGNGPQLAAGGTGGRNELYAVPHEHYLHLDQCPDGRWQLTHMGTRERRILPAPPAGGRYQVAFDDDGYGIVLCIDDLGRELEERASFAEDILAFAFYERPDGTHSVVQHQRRGAPLVVHLAEFERQYAQSMCSITFGPSEKSVDIAVCVFRWARGDSKYFLSTACLYKALALQQFGGHSSRWVYNSRRKWMKFLRSLHLDEALQMSFQVGKAGRGNADEAAAGVLPFTGVSPAGLIALLDRFLRPTRYGGLNSEGARLNSRWLLEVLLQVAMQHMQGETLPLDLTRNWTNTFPRPKLFSHRIDLRVLEDRVDTQKHVLAGKGRLKNMHLKSIPYTCTRHPLPYALYPAAYTLYPTTFYPTRYTLNPLP